MKLHTDLARLAGDQPDQPVDRLAAVSRKAHRIRRTRVAITIAAGLALLAPAGIVLAERPQDNAAASRFAGTTVASWPDRSTVNDRDVAEGAVEQWLTSSGRAGGAPADLRWLYRGVVEVPQGPSQYVAAWTADGRVVVGSVERGAVTGTTPWRLADRALDQAQGLLTLYLPQITDGETGDNWLFVLADPRARTLHWTAVPLTAAPTGPGIIRQGALTSTNGVFQGFTGTITGMLQATIDESDAAPALLTFPDAVPRLAPAADLTALHRGQVAGTAGQVTDGEVSNSEPTSPADHLRNVVVRCYGGGTLTLLLDGVMRGSAPCDLEPHVVALNASLGISHHVQVRGGRLQVYVITVV